jgi:hypothetical protein
MEQSARNHLECNQVSVKSAWEVIQKLSSDKQKINIYLQVWKSLGDFFPKLYCIDLAEAYVTRENVSSEILREKKRYDLRLPNGHLHEKPLAKGGMGKESRY